MARGNWRSGRGHGPAEVGSRQRLLDGYYMRVSGTFDREYDARESARILEIDGYHTHVTKGRTLWTVWRTYRKGQKRVK